MKRVNVERILCPIDFSEFSRDALDHAVALASWYHATLTVMHVVDLPGVPIDRLVTGPGVFEPPVDADKVLDDVRDFAQPAVGTTGVALDAVVRFGAPALEIQSHAKRMGADLVVTGTHGRSGFQRFLLGSLTERLLRVLAVPFLIVPPPVKRPATVRYDTVLCPTDFSDESMRALDYALSLAQEAGGKIVLLHVLEGLLDELDPERIGNVHLVEYLRGLEQDALERLRAAVPDEARLWAHPVERIARGRAYRQILATAERERASLIVMGVRGKGALDRLFFGTTTEHVIRDAPCPVLTLHAEVATDRSEPTASDDVTTSER